MALIIFKYCLPILLGFTLFASITGRYMPIPRPKALAKRPLWFLGLWTGASIGIITLLGVNLAYRMDLNELSGLVTPGLWITAAAMVPGVVGFLWYRSSVKRQIAAEQDTRLIGAIEQADTTDFDNTLAVALDDASELDATVQIDDAVILDTELLEADRQYGSWSIELEGNASDDDEYDETQLFDVTSVETVEPSLFGLIDEPETDDRKASTLEQHKVLAAAVEEGPAEDDADKIIALDELVDTTESDTLFGFDETTEIDDAAISELSLAMETEKLERAAEIALAAETARQQHAAEMAAAAETTRQEHAAELALAVETSQQAHNADMAMATETARQEHALQINELRNELASEIKSRKELETHLRITRKGLGELESETREFESNKAAALIEMEQELQEKIKRTAAAEARAEREVEKRTALEQNMVHLREDALKATTENRISTEARAKALSTASKATTFARQAMQNRTRLETQLTDAQADVDSKQSTISSLIKALEKEKSRTQEDVAAMAKQLVLHEKQLQARRTLEEVSRSVDNKLSTRLVKKVAKARS